MASGCCGRDEALTGRRRGWGFGPGAGDRCWKGCFLPDALVTCVIPVLSLNGRPTSSNFEVKHTRESGTLVYRQRGVV